MSKEIRVDLSRYLVPPGSDFSLASVDSSETQGYDDKSDLKDQVERNVERIAKLQEALYAEDRQSVLLVLQAMDAGGKDSTIEAITRGVNPQGFAVSGFKAPSKEELAHDFLWRIHHHAPEKGHVAIFNRSHYEDVLIVRVNGWAPPELIEKRYGHINAFERLLYDHGTRIVKVMLHISPAYQLEQFRERLVESDKHWKFNPDDLKTRAQWHAYMEAFETVFRRCSTEYAPWYVVPAESKWYRCMVVSQILLDLLEDMDPRYPEPDYDFSQYSADRLAALDPLSDGA